MTSFASNPLDHQSSLSLQSAQTLSMGELAGLEAQALMRLQLEANATVDQAKSMKDWIEGAIAFKYATTCQSLRQQQGKETGTIHFQDGSVRVTADLPKKPVWDQRQLAEIASRIQAGGEDPSEYLDISYKVPERKYTAWPDSLRSSFAAARTLKTGKPTFRLQQTEEAQ